MPGTGLYAKKFVEVLGRRLAYHEAGSGDVPISVEIRGAGVAG